MRKCKTEGAQEVISLLTSIFSPVGPALTLTSDNGSTLLRNQAVKSFLATWGVQSVSLSLPYSPLHNARAERDIKAFHNLMRLFTDKHETKWASLTDKIYIMLLHVYFKSTSAPSHYSFGAPPPLHINTSLVSDPTATTSC